MYSFRLWEKKFHNLSPIFFFIRDQHLLKVSKKNCGFWLLNLIFSVVFLRILNVKRPVVPDNEKIKIITHGRGCFTLNAKFGFGEAKSRVSEVMSLAHRRHGLPNHDLANYYIHHEHVKVSGFSWKWPAVKIFALMKNLFNESRSIIKIDSPNTMQVGVFTDIRFQKSKKVHARSKLLINY